MLKCADSFSHCDSDLVKKTSGLISILSDKPCCLNVFVPQNQALKNTWYCIKSYMHGVCRQCERLFESRLKKKTPTYSAEIEKEGC